MILKNILIEYFSLFHFETTQGEESYKNEIWVRCYKGVTSNNHMQNYVYIPEYADLSPTNVFNYNLDIAHFSPTVIVEWGEDKIPPPKYVSELPYIPVCEEYVNNS